VAHCGDCDVYTDGGGRIFAAAAVAASDASAVEMLHIQKCVTKYRVIGKPEYFVTFFELSS